MFTKCQLVKECVRAQMWWTGNSVTVHHKTQTWRQRLRAAFGIKRTKNMTS